jgi:hypothetical protein
MTSEERAEILVTARLLRVVTPVQWLAVALTVLAASRVLQGRAPIGAGAAIVAGVVAVFYGVRISFDARLLEDVAGERLSTVDLDNALTAFGTKNVNRSWSDRCRGAKHLVISFMTAAIAQVIAVVSAGWS